MVANRAFADEVCNADRERLLVASVADDRHVEAFKHSLRRPVLLVPLFLLVGQRDDSLNAVIIKGCHQFTRAAVPCRPLEESGCDL